MRRIWDHGSINRTIFPYQVGEYEKSKEQKKENFKKRKGEDKGKI
jgi:hypothetical protein